MLPSNNLSRPDITQRGGGMLKQGGLLFWSLKTAFLANFDKKITFVGFCWGVEHSAGHEKIFVPSEMTSIKTFLLEFCHISIIKKKYRTCIIPPPKNPVFFGGGAAYLALNRRGSQHVSAFTGNPQTTRIGVNCSHQG